MSVADDSFHLGRSLDSLSQQSLADYELIVILDGAPPPVNQNLKRRAERDPRIRLFAQERLGLTASLNRALGLARGEFVARQDCDDWSQPQRLERQLAFLRRNGAELSTCHAAIVDEKDRPMGLRTPPSDPVSLRRLLERYNCLQHSSLMARRDSLAELGGYRQEFIYSQDYDLYLRALAKGRRIAVLPEVLVTIRMTPWNITTVRRKEQLRFALRAQRDYFESVGASSLRAWLATGHHRLRLWVPDSWRAAKRRLLEGLR